MSAVCDVHFLCSFLFCISHTLKSAQVPLCFPGGRAVAAFRASEWGKALAFDKPFLKVRARKQELLRLKFSSDAIDTLEHVIVSCEGLLSWLAVPMLRPLGPGTRDPHLRLRVHDTYTTQSGIT